MRQSLCGDRKRDARESVSETHPPVPFLVRTRTHLGQRSRWPEPVLFHNREVKERLTFRELPFHPVERLAEFFVVRKHLGILSGELFTFCEQKVNKDRER